MKASTLLLAFALCWSPGCTEEPSAVRQRQYSEEGKMREWRSRGRAQAPQTYGPSGKQQMPSPAVSPSQRH
jgi:hypothetical protein